MGTITKRGELQWQAKVRRRGFPAQSRTFSYKEDAERWVRAMERELETTGFIDRREAERNTLADILLRYQQEVTPQKKSAVIESTKIKVLLKDAALTQIKISALNSSIVAAWRDRRLKQVSGATVNREIDVLSAAINHARREWGIHIENPVPLVRRPEKAKARDRRFTDEEMVYLLAALTGGERLADGTFSKGARNPWLQPLVELAVETAMRRGELLALRWECVNLARQTAFLPDTKNGDSRMVPLSRKAVAILQEYDDKYTSNLLETMSIYVQEHGEISAVAGRLFQHPNTIRYRLKKARELLVPVFGERDFYEQLFITLRLQLYKKLTF